MSRKSRQRTADGVTARQLDIQRIRVNAQGYDATGAYWGAGPDVFVATTAAGAEEITVRARNVTEARAKAAAELERTPAQPEMKQSRGGTARSEQRAPIGGASPHKSRYDIDWLNPVTNETVRIRITHARDYLSTGSDHIEVESVKPKKTPLPITETGYRSHFMPALDLINAGGPVTFVTAWIAQESKVKAWTKSATSQAQGDLFQWAEANKEVAPRKPRKPAPPMARPRKTPAPDRTPR